MPATTFPYISMLGYTEEHEAQEKIEIYDDLTYRRYLYSTTIHKVLNNVFKDINDTKKDTIKSFWDARKASSTPANFEFYIFNPEETFVVASVAPYTGRYVGIFHEPKISFSRAGKCRWNINIPVLLLSTAYA